MMNKIGKRTSRLPYNPLTLGLIQPEWLFMYYYLMEEPDEEDRNCPTETIGKKAKETAIRIHFRARREPAVF